MGMAIVLQTAVLDVEQALKRFRAGLRHSGGEAFFIGRMRSETDHRGKTVRLRAMTLECYPQMVQSEATIMQRRAQAFWALEDVLLIHRYGEILPQQTLVVVATAAAHRDAACAACRYMIDWLKVKAPFWKYEHFENGGGAWVKAKKDDAKCLQAWERQLEETKNAATQKALP